MMDERAALRAIVAEVGECAVAVSGGVDSTTLAAFAHAEFSSQIQMFHAVSPAVPQAATVRLTNAAKVRGWALHRIDAGELDDPNYRRNPANRCFFCKSNLYQTMRNATDAVLLSGANLDDLNDIRPGLSAAADHNVRHPFIEAGFTKSMIRTLARDLNLPEFADLPSSPCLSSRLETGVRVEPQTLIAIDGVETRLRLMAFADTLRCRVRHAGVVVELDAPSLQKLETCQRTQIERCVSEFFPDRPVAIEAYRRGSAFLHATTSHG